MAQQPRLFGTDGVRGLANDSLTAELALDLSVAAAHVLGDAGVFAGHRPRAVVGRDPRASGEFLESAVVAGLASAGVDVVRIGVAPTPAVAFLTGDLDADLGVMLSASHNPMPDNGIKFFSRGGHKLADDVEDAVESRMGEPWARPTGRLVGRVTDDTSVLDRYVGHVVGALPHRLEGLTVVVDGAHGAASTLSPRVLRDAGAHVVALNCEPDGWNINDGCGSTHLAPLQEAVVAHGADLGIAHDGDADRCLAVAHDGSLVDGDQILAVLALALRRDGVLARDTVVSTVMANLGFRLAMKEHRIEVVETGVGDRYVLEAMHAGGYTLGGEQSGHVILLDHASTGDGLLTAARLASEVARSGRSLAELAQVMTRLPQVLVNVPDVDKARVDDPDVRAAVDEAASQLGDAGRVLLRPSGTEPLVRVMVEATDLGVAQRHAHRIATVVAGGGSRAGVPPI